MSGKNIFANTFLFLTMPILLLIHRPRFIGTHNIPKGGGFIIAANHLLALDAFYVALGCQRQINFMAKSELFRNPIFDWFFRSLKAFPVKRGFFDRGALKQAEKIINSGEVLGIFPEGARSLVDGKPKKAKWGVAYIAKECKCDVIPASLYCSNGAKPFSKLTVRFGKPIKFDELGLDENSQKAELVSASDLIMTKINVLWEKGHERN